MKIQLIILLVSLLTLAPLGSTQILAATPMSRPLRATLLSPPHAENPFWSNYIAFMQEAADDLGIELSIVEYRHRFDEVRAAQRLFAQDEKPDYLLHLYYAQNTLEVLTMAEQAGVKSIICNTDVVPSERKLAGRPGEKFPHWVGHIYPDDKAAGKMLTEKLIQVGKACGMFTDDNHLHMIGISANRETTASLYREQGLQDSIAAHPEAILQRVLHTNWDRKLTREKATRLMDMYPDVKVWWGVHDGTALGILEASREYGFIPGKDILVGGIDWSEEGIMAVKNGRMSATCGGHFMEGAWALIMALDHHETGSFASTSPVVRSQMRLIDYNSLSQYAPVLNQANWPAIDFRQFTKTYNPGLKQYDFSPDAVVRALQ